MVFRVTLSGHCFRPWATAVAIGVLAAMVETQTDTTLLEQVVSTPLLTWVRQTLGWIWAAYAAVLAGRATVAFMRRRARLGASADPISAFPLPYSRAKSPKHRSP